MIHNIRLSIATGKITTPGRLPSERSLAEQFGVGRGTVREAIRALELLGIVDVRRGRDGGIFTASNAPDVARKSFTSFARMHASFLATLEFRKALEPRAAALAAVRATAEHVAVIDQSIVAMEANPASVDVFITSNRLFHETIADATANPYIRGALSHLLGSSEVSTSAGQANASQRTLALFFHKKIAEAIRARNAPEAQTWMEAHFSQLESDFHRGRELTGSTCGC